MAGAGLGRGQSSEGGWEIFGVSNLLMMVSKGNHPTWPEFRLVKCSNLPRKIYVYYSIHSDLERLGNVYSL